uniref:Uncharacterized protein n=1 Tax=Micrurus lemniscatus lemniscatus TaxID=129467 RepID=A0A2D4J249_MICLE
MPLLSTFQVNRAEGVDVLIVPWLDDYSIISTNSSIIQSGVQGKIIKASMLLIVPSRSGRLWLFTLLKIEYASSTPRFLLVTSLLLEIKWEHFLNFRLSS